MENAKEDDSAKICVKKSRKFLWRWQTIYDRFKDDFDLLVPDMRIGRKMKMSLRKTDPIFQQKRKNKVRSILQNEYKPVFEPEVMMPVRNPLSLLIPLHIKRNTQIRVRNFLTPSDYTNRESKKPQISTEENYKKFSGKSWRTNYSERKPKISRQKDVKQLKKHHTAKYSRKKMEKHVPKLVDINVERLKQVVSEMSVTKLPVSTGKTQSQRSNSEELEDINIIKIKKDEPEKNTDFSRRDFGSLERNRPYRCLMEEDVRLMASLRFPSQRPHSSTLEEDQDYVFRSWLYYSPNIPKELKYFRERSHLLFAKGFLAYPDISKEAIHVSTRFAYLHGKRWALKVFRSPKYPFGIYNDFIKALVKVENIYSRINHPFILENSLLYQEGKRFFIIREYCNRGSLATYVNHRVLRVSTSRKYFRQVVEAVNYLHERGISHRNIKLQNCLLDADDNVKLCDPLVSVASWTQAELTVFRHGPLIFIAPEMINRDIENIRRVPRDIADCRYRHEISFRQRFRTFADLWSLGVLLFCLLWGYAPFDDEYYKRILKGENLRPLPRPDDTVRRKTIPVAAMEIYDSLIQVNYNRRPSAKQLLENKWVSPEPGLISAVDDLTEPEVLYRVYYNITSNKGLNLPKAGDTFDLKMFATEKQYESDVPPYPPLIQIFPWTHPDRVKYLDKKYERPRCEEEENLTHTLNSEAHHLPWNDRAYHLPWWKRIPNDVLYTMEPFECINLYNGKTLDSSGEINYGKLKPYIAHPGCLPTGGIRKKILEAKERIMHKNRMAYQWLPPAPCNPLFLPCTDDIKRNNEKHVYYRISWLQSDLFDKAYREPVPYFDASVHPIKDYLDECKLYNAFLYKYKEDRLELTPMKNSMMVFMKNDMFANQTKQRAYRNSQRNLSSNRIQTCNYTSNNKCKDLGDLSYSHSVRFEEEYLRLMLPTIQDSMNKWKNAFEIMKPSFKDLDKSDPDWKKHHPIISRDFFQCAPPLGAKWEDPTWSKKYIKKFFEFIDKEPFNKHVESA